MGAEASTANFGAASEKLPGVFGGSSPGTPGKPDTPYAEMEEGSIGNDVVKEWANALKGHGITRTLCLLSPDELLTYAEPGYTELLKAEGLTPSIVNLASDKAWDKANMSLLAAEANKEKSAKRKKAKRRTRAARPTAPDANAP